MIILSFDIGIKNLAYCLIDSEDKTILDWYIIDCSDKKYRKLTKFIFGKLESPYNRRYMRNTRKLST